MIWIDIWAQMTVRTPSLSNPKAMVTMSAEQFKKALEQAYHAGLNHKKEQPKNNTSFGDIFSMFNGAK